MNVRALTLALILTGGMPGAWGQSPSTPPSAPAPAAETAPASPAAAPATPLPSAAAPASGGKVPLQADPSDQRSRADVSAALAADLPKYNPPKASEVDLLTQVSAPDSREIDKPKNEIKRLPKYVVRQSTPPIFRNKDLYTKDGQTDLAMKKYAGLGFIPPLAFLNRGVADQMAAEDDRLGNMADLKDSAASMARGGDATESDFIRRASQDTYIRDEGWTWNGPGGGGR